MKRLCAWATVILLAAGCAMAQTAGPAYAGFDRNDYPGDQTLAALRKDFRYTVYWVNNPPGEQRNTWDGKRALLKQQGFGFLVLFNGRPDAELKGKDAAALGNEDGKAAAVAASREGFARNTLIFLDQEEGGRLLEEQADYLFAWADAVRAAGARAGVYCSGIEVKDSSGSTSTALDILSREKARAGSSGKNTATAHQGIKLWVANDQCPPSPGCTLAHVPPLGILPAEFRGSTVVWQYAQSPRRAQFTAGCPANYSADGKCYAPGLAQGPNAFVDLDTANSADPSEK